MYTLQDKKIKTIVLIKNEKQTDHLYKAAGFENVLIR